MHRTTREEAETTIVFNRHEGSAEWCTADPAIMRRWRRVGWPVVVLGRYRDSTPRTWTTTVPWRKAIRFARLGTGSGPARGRPKRPFPTRSKDVTAADQPAASPTLEKEPIVPFVKESRPGRFTPDGF